MMNSSLVPNLENRFCHSKCLEWSLRDEEFVKRAGFSLMAALAVHDRKAPDEVFEQFLQVISRKAEGFQELCSKGG